MKSFKKQCIILCTILFFSCSQSLDFDQVQDYSTKPTFSTALTFFTLSSNNFTADAGSPPITEISEESDFKLFGNTFIKQNLVKLDFDFEIRNEFDRDLTIEISLLNDNDNLVYKFEDLKVTANNLDFKQQEVIDITTSQNVKNFTKVEINLSLDDKTRPIDASDIGLLEFKSAATVYLDTSL